jgi:hypothetical protein
MDTLEGNKLIAVFMGAKLKYYNISNAPYYLMPNKQQWMPERLVYHTSWDWLMPVVNKIICTNPTIEDAFKNTYKVVDTLMYIQIERTWKAVVVFIEWLNKAENVQVSDTTMLPNEQMPVK